MASVGSGSRLDLLGEFPPGYLQPDSAVFCFPDEVFPAILDDSRAFVDWLVKVFVLALLHLGEDLIGFLLSNAKDRT
jgi:hypothetical protein